MAFTIFSKLVCENVQVTFQHDYTYIFEVQKWLVRQHVSKFNRIVLVLFLCHIPYWNIWVFLSCTWHNVAGISTMLSIPTSSLQRVNSVHWKHLILVLYQMLMLSEIFGEVLGSSNIESALQHRKLLGETSKGFGIQTGPPHSRKHLEKGWSKKWPSCIHRSKRLDHIKKR